MAIQFLDERLSVHRNNSAGAEPITTTPLFIGDIGLQTLAAAPAGNADLVRVALTGIAGVALGVEQTANITLTIERNGTGTAGTGTVIYTDTLFLGGGSFDTPPISVVAGDFPPANVVEVGQIRYSLFISSDTDTGVTLNGPAVFNGSASAGTS
ncbi:hypothetical protein DFQ01_13523 [Paenibacillus cellulosilyticus]|uniref:Exosporium-targeted protein n=1 Tax=Paenibacillus cellulosilyticus TaxID=375489 RepID=A0A2V2YGX6_9BACL|nr:hypothetical protein [Paenibacillus cellulosilyticus]PWV92462.1 hypothetical protein DFQ01_13523 [Paenibacillus cellulosilyticus]QKS47037.1 hypothetical protein HUB94_21475 [Paenibacillus cellulosilyticus]